MTPAAPPGGETLPALPACAVDEPLQHDLHAGSLKRLQTNHAIPFLWHVYVSPLPEGAPSLAHGVTRHMVVLQTYELKGVINVGQYNLKDQFDVKDW